MILNKAKPQQKIIIILSIIVVVLFIFSLIPKKPKQTSTTEPISTNLKQQVLSQLPHTENDFIIQYLNHSDTYVITVTNTPYQESLDKAYIWLSQRNITKDNSKIFEAFSRLKPQ